MLGINKLILEYFFHKNTCHLVEKMYFCTLKTKPNYYVLDTGISIEIGRRSLACNA